MPSSPPSKRPPKASSSGTPRKSVTPGPTAEHSTPRATPKSRRGSVGNLKGEDERLARQAHEAAKKREAAERARDLEVERLELGDMLRSAAAAGDLAKVGELCRNPVLDVDNTSDEGTTALMKAAMYGHADIVAALLEKGASPDVADAHRRSAVHLAAANGEVEALSTLLNAGAMVDKPSKNEFSVLSWAAASGCVAAIEVLFEVREAEAVTLLHACDSNGRRAYEIALEYDQNKAAVCLQAAEKTHPPPLPPPPPAPEPEAVTELMAEAEVEAEAEAEAVPAAEAGAGAAVEAAPETTPEESAAAVVASAHKQQQQQEEGGGARDAAVAATTPTEDSSATDLTAAGADGEDTGGEDTPSQTSPSQTPHDDEEAAEAKAETKATAEKAMARTPVAEAGPGDSPPSARRKLDLDGGAIADDERQEIAELKILLGKE